MRDRMIALEARIERLEYDKAVAEKKLADAAKVQAQQPALASTAATASPAKAPAVDPLAWAQRFTLKGDVRVRHDRIDAENVDARDRERYRLRLGVTAQVNDTTTAIVSLASGGTDPIARNQTFDGGLSTKGINIEQVFVLWKPAAVAGLEVSAGKFKQTFKNIGDVSLIWDADLNPEGAALSYTRKTGFGQVFASAASWWIQERAASSDSVMLGGQAGAVFDLGANGGRLTAGAGFYRYRDTQGRDPFFDKTNGFGNTTKSGKYLHGYANTEAFAEWKGQIGSATTTAFADWVRNSDAGADDSGYAVGASATMSGVTLGYAWKQLDADAVVGAFADSDFGLGGTDVRGHILTFGYELAHNVAAKVTYFKVQAGRDAGNERDVNRVQADVNVKF